jgi:hypothetical protein
MIARGVNPGMRNAQTVGALGYQGITMRLHPPEKRGAVQMASGYTIGGFAGNQKPERQGAQFWHGKIRALNPAAETGSGRKWNEIMGLRHH